MGLIGLTALLLAGVPVTGVTGNYTVSGTCPGQARPYTGTITLTQPGALYRLVWRLDSGQTSTGQALEQDGQLAIAYELDGGSGVMIARRTAEGWEGRWAMTGADRVCVERWRRR